MKLDNKINYHIVTDYQRLKHLMNKELMGIDFEFAKNFQPLAVGIAHSYGIQEFRFSNLKTPDRLRALQSIEYPDFILLIHLLGDLKQNEYLVYGSSDIQCLNYLYKTKKYNSLLPDIVVYDVQPVLSHFKDKNGIYRSRSLFETAIIAGVETNNLIEHHPGSDALCLLETAKLLASKDEDYYEAFKRRLFDQRFMTSIKAFSEGQKEKHNVIMSLENKLRTIQGELNSVKGLLNQTISNQNLMMERLNKREEHSTNYVEGEKIRKKTQLKINKLKALRLFRGHYSVTDTKDSFDQLTPSGKLKNKELGVFCAQVDFHTLNNNLLAVSLRRNGTKMRTYKFVDDNLNPKACNELKLKNQALLPFEEFGRRLSTVSGNGQKIVLISDFGYDQEISLLKNRLNAYIDQHAYKIVTV